MRVSVFAIGRLKTGPDRDGVERYLDRAGKAGRALGLTSISVREWDESRAARTEDRREAEARLMVEALPAGAVLVALDERGRSLTSPEFAQRVGGWRDSGRGDLVFAIGGADGHGDAIRTRADLLLSFGAMTWPHQLVRLMLAEQIYRVTTILAGHPYHRV
jgi:23S rRNA (pseudouridine1915-N3)-methyltransferase